MLTKERNRRKRRIRSKVTGTSSCPRLSVFRSNKYIYGQLIDDEKRKTVAEAHGVKAKEVGEEIAKKALKIKIKRVVFDRSGYQYHGKVKELAEGAQSGGLKI